MLRSFWQTRIGPLISLVGSLITGLYVLLPFTIAENWTTSEVQEMTGRNGMLDLLILFALLATLGTFSLSLAAFFFPRATVLRGLGLLSACVGLLTQLNLAGLLAMNLGMPIAPFPILLQRISIFWPQWPSLIGLLLSASSIGLGMWKGQRAGGQILSEKRNWWHIGKQQIIAMIIGTLIYSVLSNCSLMWEGPGEYEFFTLLPEIVGVLFLSMAYGPWVGAVAAGIGSILNITLGSLTHIPIWVISNYGLYNSPELIIPRPSLTWAIIGPVLTGFLAGLPLFPLPKWDLSTRAVLAVVLRSTLAIVIGLTVSVSIASRTQPNATDFFINILANEVYIEHPTLVISVFILPGLLAMLAGRENDVRKV